MTTTVTVKTKDHAAYVGVGSQNDKFTSVVYLLLPGAEKEFTVTDTQSINVYESETVNVVHPDYLHATVSPL